MNLSKRDFIKSAPIFAATPVLVSSQQKTIKNDVFCGNSKPFIFKNEPARVRKSFYDLTDDELKNLCRSVGYMRKNIPLNSPLQWEVYAKIHAYHCTLEEGASSEFPQVHWSWHFLPWHRGYIYFLERILDNILKQKFGWNGVSFAYPYWDWINHQEMPNTKSRKQAGLASPLFGYDLTQEDMVKSDNLDFDNLALYDGNRKPTVEQPTMDVNNEISADSKQHIIETKWYMSRDYINAILKAPFELFGGRSTIDRNTGQGLLEQGPHNNGHDWVGTRIGNNRNMGTLRYAANDPIFFMHHANLDRIWSLYKNEMPDPNGPWGKQSYTYVDIDGSPITVTVKDIVTKMNNVTYQSPSDEPIIIKSDKSNYSTNKITIPVSKTLTSEGLSIDIPNDDRLNKLFDSKSHLSILTIETGPISYVDKFKISVAINDKNIGKVNLLDGRRTESDVTISHEFNMTIGIGKESIMTNLNSVISGYPKKINFKLNNVKDKQFKLSIRSLTFTIVE